MNSGGYDFFDLADIISRFAEHADSVIVDAYLSDRQSASSRVFRLYGPLPKHLHKTCDEHLVLLRGEVDFTIANEAPRRLKPGQMVTFLRNTVHSILPVEGAAPGVFFTVDAPRRDPDDVHFVNPSEAAGLRFVTHLADYGPRLD
jgi:mannose-6-phosphate isomerase-like protein (cupin superfamily)